MDLEEQPLKLPPSALSWAVSKCLPRPSFPLFCTQPTIMASSSFNLPRFPPPPPPPPPGFPPPHHLAFLPPLPPPPPPHGFPPPHHPLHHLALLPPPPLPPLLDLAESSARPLPHKPKYKPSHGYPPFHHPPGPISSPPSSTMPKPKPRRKPDLALAAAPKTTTPPCTECGKRFSSWKALFGHMRCHPERQWRGINPPPHLRRLPRAEHFTDEEYEVAASLIMLSRGPPRDTSSDAVLSLPSPSQQQQQQQAISSTTTNARGGLAAVAGVAMSSRDGSCGGWKRPREVEIEATSCDHKCNVCSRGFSTGQALGGHKRCHWEKGEEGVGGCSSSGKYVLDLNLPPPLESNEGNPSNVLDLRLGI